MAFVEKVREGNDTSLDGPEGKRAVFYSDRTLEFVSASEDGEAEEGEDEV